VAIALEISGSSVQRNLRDLEQILRGPLVHQSPNGLVANEAAMELARRLSLAARELDLAREEIRATRGLLDGRIAIGTQQLSGACLLADVLPKVVAKWPAANIYAVNSDYGSLVGALRSGAIDFMIGLLRNPTPFADIVQHPLIPDRYVVVAGPSHPLARKSRVTLREIARYSWIAPIPGAFRRNAFDRLFAKLDPVPRPRMETHSLMSIRALLAATDHLTLLTQFEADIERRGGHLKTLACPLPDVPATIGVTTRAGWLPTTVQQAFLDFVQEHCIALRSRRNLRELPSLVA
jgi:DNA-binding transcriptional LysR family regulator